MTDTTKTNDTEKKPLHLKRPGKLELKKTVDAGSVRQNFSHGRSKMVTVEVKKKRSFAQDASGRMSQVREGLALPAGAAKAFSPPPAQTNKDDNLTSAERQTRAKALQEAKIRAVEEEKRKLDEAARLAQQEKDIAAAEALRLSKQAAEKTAEPETKPAPKSAVKSERTSEAQTKPTSASVAEKPRPKTAQKPASRPYSETKTNDAKAKKSKKSKNADKATQPARPRGEPRRRAGKLTISSALSGNDERQRSLASVKRKREKEKQQQKQARAAGQKIVREVIVPESITVQELANRMAERSVDVIRELMKMGVMATINQAIDADTAELVVEEFGHTMQRVSEADVETGLMRGEDKSEDLKPRPPVVTVM